MMASRLLIAVLALAVVTSAEFVNKYPNPRGPIEEDAGLPTIDLIVKYGYPAEVHSVRTDDGYILEMHRIPYSPLSPEVPNKPVVFLQHGLLCASSDWVLMGPDKGLAYLMADAGYDVWMGNSRGNTYSRKHAVFDPDASDGRFWEFSWHEMGMYDITAEIDYVLANVGQPKLFYIGHSQGTTQFYVMASERPEYNAKIRAMFSLAPVGFMNNLDNLFLQVIAKADDMLWFALNFMGIYEFMPSTPLMEMIGQKLCNDEAFTQVICANVLFLIAGWNSEQLNNTMIPVIMGHTPAGASTRQMIHYAQEVNSAKFRQLEYGLLGNLNHYGQTSPPKYNLKLITCPVALHYSENDLLSSPMDVERLYQQLGNPIGKFLVPLKKFNHLDYLWAIDVRTLLYNKVLSLMSGF